MQKRSIFRFKKTYRRKLSKADLHIHSNHSDGRPGIAEILEYVEKETDLDIIAITDHDTIDGALEAKKIMDEKNYRFDLIVGEEISTEEGHILGLFLKEAIPAKIGLKEALAEIKKQGGLAIVPHPFQVTRMNNGKNVTMDGIGAKNVIKYKRMIEGVEVINATPTLGAENIEASVLNSTIIFQAEIGDSDAHILEAIGKAYTVFEGKTAHDLRKAIEKNQTKAVHDKWSIFALAKYLFFFIPIGFRMLWYTLIHGIVRPKWMEK